MAIGPVTDLERIRALAKGRGLVGPGEMRRFSNAERTEAIDWACVGFERES